MFELRPYQREGVDSINAYFRDGKGSNPILVEPTGAGKSIMIATYIDELQQEFNDVRVMVLTHVKELISQNSNKLIQQNPELDVGIYSAGLNMRHHWSQFLFAGIASVHKRVEQIGHVDVCIVDECHLISAQQSGMYRKMIAELRVNNPDMPVIGFTATNYRLGHGYITEGENAIFDGVCHETPIEFLIEEGYLVRPIAKVSDITADLSNVKHNSFGEFKEADLAEAFDAIIVDACKDMIEKSKDRNCRLVFCSGVEHAKHVCACLDWLGEERIAYLDGTTDSSERADLVADIVAGKYKWVVNIGVLTTGFDAPIIDTVILLIATESTSKYVQIIGRGLRIMEGKETCQVLDYGANVQRHGALNALVVKTPTEKAVPNLKICPKCKTIVGAQTVRCPDTECDYVWMKDCAMCETEYTCNLSSCPDCGYIPIPEEVIINHETRAGEADLIAKIPNTWWTVKSMYLSRHKKKNSPDSIRVTYGFGVGVMPIEEYLCLDHGGYATQKAKDWMSKFGVIKSDLNVDDALEHLWRTPKEILVKQEGKYQRVIDYTF